MPNPLSTDVVVGTYARGDARMVLTRHRGTNTVTISLDRPCITLDPAGHRALLQALALPVLETHPVHGPVPAFSSVPKIGGAR